MRSITKHISHAAFVFEALKLPAGIAVAIAASVQVGIVLIDVRCNCPGSTEAEEKSQNLAFEDHFRSSWEWWICKEKTKMG